MHKFSFTIAARRPLPTLILGAALSAFCAIAAFGQALDLSPAFGQGFAAFEEILGRPSSQTPAAKGQDEQRVYKREGFTRILLRQAAGAETVHLVEAGFPKEIVRSWKDAFAQIGLANDGVELRRQGNAYRLTGLPEKWQVDWIPNNPAKQEHTLIIHLGSATRSKATKGGEGTPQSPTPKATGTDAGGKALPLHPQYVSGPHKGTNKELVSAGGARPQVLLFANPLQTDLDHLMELCYTLDAALERNERSGLSAHLVVLNIGLPGASVGTEQWTVRALGTLGKLNPETKVAHALMPISSKQISAYQFRPGMLNVAIVVHEGKVLSKLADIKGGEEEQKRLADAIDSALNAVGK